LKEEKFFSERIRSIGRNLALRTSGFLVPLLQYLPAIGPWLGLMSIPLIGFLILLFQFPFMYSQAFELIFLRDYYGKSIFILGLVFFIYSFIYQLYHRKSLINKGPYKLFKHPQYIAICLMTFGLTILCYHYYSSVIPLFGSFYIDRIWIVITWVIEVLLYVILAKIENYSLKSRFGEYYLEYAESINDLWRSKNNNETEVRLFSLAIVLLMTFALDYLFYLGFFEIYDIFFLFLIFSILVLFLSSRELKQ